LAFIDERKGDVMGPAVPASLTGSNTKLRSSTVLAGLILTWLSADALVPMAAFALGLIGLSIVLGFWRSSGERWLYLCSC
jgi:hypothetical protein